MTDDRDAKLAKLLRANAPDARDPLFRLGVHERRERMRFRRRTALLTLAAIAVVALAVVAAKTSTRLLEPAGVLFFGVVLTLAALVLTPMLVRVLQRFRS